ncbi:sigma factor-like helix-turn-helix DNA-binding protein [Neobittarella massiliensis]|uniref:sigma factor-like helix-turn-helix DNA-binding protein n=1 Tax=Neobittarella massiliensis (ex Bilen et al. 2018) TaxID=2041842 RepID=UPI000CF5DC05|nr:sigma factor-like helix-turn-helix DNA-binding protein [Neobittarella massiliensis]
MPDIAAQLAQLPHLRREITQLTAEIERLREAMPHATDVVKASAREYPYTEGCVTVSGIDLTATEAHRYSLEISHKLSERSIRRDQLLDLADSLEREINKLPDSRHRQVLRLRYIEGLTIEETAEQMDYSVRRICDLQKEATERLHSIA